jgi:hypothetical protein
MLLPDEMRIYVPDLLHRVSGDLVAGLGKAAHVVSPDHDMAACAYCSSVTHDADYVRELAQAVRRYYETYYTDEELAATKRLLALLRGETGEGADQ